MSIVVTGSIAFDYLMSFPGKFTEHFLPEHFHRVSLSFLVDSMDKRRGGCAPNIAYTLALLGERPRIMATAGEDFGEYRAWLEAAGVDTSLVREMPGKFTASFFCSTDQHNNQIASFYTGAMADAGAALVSRRRRLPPGDRVAERPRRHGAVRRRVPDARHPVHLRPRAAVREDVGRRTPRRGRRRDDRHLQRLRVRAVPAEDRPDRARHPRAVRSAGRHARRAGLDRPHARRPAGRAGALPRAASWIRPAWATPSAAAS